MDTPIAENSGSGQTGQPKRTQPHGARSPAPRLIASLCAADYPQGAMAKWLRQAEESLGEGPPPLERSERESETQSTVVANVRRAMGLLLADLRLAGRVEEVVRELAEIHSQLDGLKGSQVGLVPVQSFAPEPYDLLQPFYVTVRASEGCFIASFVDAHISAGGDTVNESVDVLKSVIIDTFEHFSGLPTEALGPVPARTLAVLQQFMCARADCESQ